MATSAPFLSSRAAMGKPMRPVPIQPSLCLFKFVSPMISSSESAQVGAPIPLFQDLLELAQEAGRGRAVDCAVVERLRQDADRMDGHGAPAGHGLVCHRVGGVD